MPGLVILDLIRNSDWSTEDFVLSRDALERLVAMHTVFPTRARFYEKDAKKWHNIHDVLLYEHVEGMLKSFKDFILSDEQTTSQASNFVMPVAHPDLTWILFDIAVRSLPASDIRKRQAEQVWLDALFISLAHVLCPRLPQLTPTGVVQQIVSASSESRNFESLEDLMNVVLTRKVRISLPVLEYLLFAVVELGEQSTPWTLLAKIARVDVNVLIPNTGLSRSGDLLNKVLERIEADTISAVTCALVRDDLVLPLMRGFARSRDLDKFLAIWQRSLGDAIRARYTTRADPEATPAVLAWEDDEIFDEFKALLPIHAPPTMGQRLLAGLLEPLSTLGEKTGPTADVFAGLAIFSALLEHHLDQGTPINLDKKQLASILDAVMSALPRKSDYQGQRWRLWKNTRLVVGLVGIDNVQPDLERLLQPDHHFVSFSELGQLGLNDDSRKMAFKFLECLECFLVLVESAMQSSRFSKALADEVKKLTDLMDQCAHAHTSADSLAPWNGRTWECDSKTKLIAACIGGLLQRSVIFSVYPNIFQGFVGKAVEIVKQGPPTKVQGHTTPGFHELLEAVLQVHEVVNTPVLCDTILQNITGSAETAPNDRKADRALLPSMFVDTMKRSQLKELASVTSARLLQRPPLQDLQATADDLALLTRLDSILTGTVIKPTEWRVWLDFSTGLFQGKDTSPGSASSLTATVHMLASIFERLWHRAIASPKMKTLAEILLWTKENIETSTDLQGQQSSVLAMQIFLSRAQKLETWPDNIIPSQKLQELQTKFVRLLMVEVDVLLREANGWDTLLDLKLTIDAALSVNGPELDGGMSQDVRDLLGWLSDIKPPKDCGEALTVYRSLKLSLERRCSVFSEVTSGHEMHKVLEDIWQFAYSIGEQQTRTNEAMALLSAKADILVRHVSPAAWPLVLESLREEWMPDDLAIFRPIFRPIATAAVLMRVESRHLVQDSRLADEVARTASLDGLSARTERSELFLDLQNCKTVLHLHPLVVNQSTMDRLLAAICAVTSATDDSSDPDDDEPADEGGCPDAADVYSQTCAVVGAILGRHRGRLSDRYHLLLPVMQNLLRCLFWPGSEGSASVHLAAFGKTLPRWMLESEVSLPPSSAEQFSRLLSSICNPTVAAARSSKKRGRHNELNDDTKRARQLAGQHMQYLVMEYARCSLDGQIQPQVKERLMPGVYSALDAMDRDLMRAMNAGMDPSSRAIFKNLYEEWTRFGKWDKS
jgi:nucleolar pre-ribosomal-associated protein 2